MIGTASSSASLPRIPAEVSERHIVDLGSAGSCADLVAAVATAHPNLDGVIVASGVVGFAALESTPTGAAMEMMAINHLGPAAVVSGLLPQLSASEAGTGYVLGITGVVVEQTFPGMSAYTASKQAHSAFLASVAREWRRHKIAAIDVRLGHTETGLASRPLFGTAPAMPVGHNPDRVARVIADAIAARQAVVPGSAFAE